MLGEGVFGITASFSEVNLIGSEIKDFNFGSLHGLAEPLIPLHSIGLITEPNKGHDFASIGKGFLKELTSLSSSYNVISSKVEFAI